MFEVIFHVLGEAVFGMTGHLILWAVTFGQWDIANGRDDAAAIVGILFWAAVAVGVWFVFFR